MKTEKFKSFDGTVLQCYLWDDVARNPKAVVQISHGMAEHARRYDNFAKFLNKNGYIVFADDHRAHGMTSTKQSSKGVQGYHKGEIFEDTAKDLVAITEYLQGKYNLPVIYLGHSYGSFLGQRYLQTDVKSAGVVLTGCANMAGIVSTLGAAVATMQYKLLGGEKPGKFLNMLSFGGFNTKFSKEGDFGWLSRDREQVKKYILDDQCGNIMSINFFRCMLCGFRDLYKKDRIAQIRKDIPVALFAGSDDPVGQSGKLVKKLYELYQDVGVQDVTMKLYDGARHEVLNETNNQEVYQDILNRIGEMLNK